MPMSYSKSKAGGRGSVGDNLLTRQAAFVYEAARLAAIAADAPVIPAPLTEREEDFRSQFLETIAKEMGPDRFATSEEAHQSWVKRYLANGWVYGETYNPEKRTHPDLVPYQDLGQLEQDKDAVFMALCDIARCYIRSKVGGPGSAGKKGVHPRSGGPRSLYCYDCGEWVSNTANYEMQREGCFAHSHICKAGGKAQ